MSDTAFPDFTSFHPGYGVAQAAAGGIIGYFSPTSPAAIVLAFQGDVGGSSGAIQPVARQNECATTSGSLGAGTGRVP
jgi:hypothetical protein